MVLPRGYGDLYHKYRPKKFGEIVGHKEVTKSIQKALTASNPSKAFLLVGDSGTGKTTTARIMALSLNCDKNSNDNWDGEPCLECSYCKSILNGKNNDLIEVNAADHRGIADIRSLCQYMPLMPLHLKKKVFILDEAHQLTNDAQSSLLKELEEAPEHVFIILCSTHPSKIIPTVKNRCQTFKFPSLKKQDMVKLLEEVATFEGHDFTQDVYNLIADLSSGSPRNGLVKLQQAIQLGSSNKRDIEALLAGSEEDDDNVMQLCFAIIGGNKRWSDITNIFDSCKHLGAPAIGMIVAGYLRNQLLKAANQDTAEKVSKMLELFVDPFEQGKLGENKLVLNLYKAYALKLVPANKIKYKNG